MPKVKTKKALEKIEGQLANADHNISRLVIAETRDNLLATFSNDFFIDTDVQTKMKKIADDMIDKEEDLKNKLHILKTEKDNLDVELAAKKAIILAIPVPVPPAVLSPADKATLDAAVKRETEITTRLVELNRVPGGEIDVLNKLIGHLNPDRQTEYQELADLTDGFDLTTDLPDMDKDTLNVEPYLMIQGVDANIYSFYYEDGRPIVGGYLTKIKLKDGTLVDVTINGLSYALPPAPKGTIDLSGLVLIDRKTGNRLDPDQSYEFTLHPGAVRTLGGKHFVNSKPLKVLRSSITALTTATKRETEIDNYNKTPLGTGHVIENRMKSVYDYQRARKERDAFFRALKDGDGPKLDKLDDEQKEDLFQRVRNTYRKPDGTPEVTVLGAKAAALLSNLNNYGTVTVGPNKVQCFRERLADDKHEGSKDPENIANQKAYMNYINNNIDEQIGKYFDRRYDNVFKDDLVTNTFLKAQVTNYMQEVDTNKIDNFTTSTALDGNIRSKAKIRGKRTYKWGIRVPRAARLNRQDVTAQSLLVNGKRDVAEQTVNISTNTNPEDHDKPEPEKYTMKVEVFSANNIGATINIGKQEKLVIKAKNPAALIQMVLRHSSIEHGKTRAHIAYNIIRSAIEIAKDKNISMFYRDPRTNHNMEIKIDKTTNNIIVEDQDEISNYGGTNERITKVLFNYKLFENTNTFEGTTNRSLIKGVEVLLNHFETAMEGAHNQYREATEKERLTKPGLPGSIRTSPIKKLLNAKTTTNFDFSTSVAGAKGQTVNISLKKNVFTITSNKLKKPIKSKYLGKLLEKRVGKVRIFDGIERDICGKVYQELVGKLRQNTKIARSNFGVLDPMTKRAYVFDEDGQLGYISAETIAKKNPIKRKNGGIIAKKVVAATALGVGGALTGGVGAIGAAFTTPSFGSIARGAATAHLRGASLATAIGLGVHLGRNSHKQRGEIETPPQGRTMCSESETKEIYKNPFLMGRLVKAMGERLGRF